MQCLRSPPTHLPEPAPPARWCCWWRTSARSPNRSRTHLKRAGFQTALARTGAEAMMLVATRDPDVILLDLALPDRDGRDVCRQIRRDSSVPIIMVTASGTVTDRVVGLELGADDYVVKPFSTGEVIARIRAVLRRGPAPPPDGAELRVQDLRIDQGGRRAWRGARRTRPHPQGVRSACSAGT